MEMSEEEKKAIKILQEEHDIMINPKLEAKYTSDEVIEALYNVIMLVRRQQKEIEEKNCLIDVLQHRIEELLDNKKEINYIKPIDIPVHNYISKDKIREKNKGISGCEKRNNKK